MICVFLCLPKLLGSPNQLTLGCSVHNGWMLPLLQNPLNSMFLVFLASMLLNSCWHQQLQFGFHESVMISPSRSSGVLAAASSIKTLPSCSTSSPMLQLLGWSVGWDSWGLEKSARTRRPNSLFLMILPLFRMGSTLSRQNGHKDHLKGWNWSPKSSNLLQKKSGSPPNSSIFWVQPPDPRNRGGFHCSQDTCCACPGAAPPSDGTYHRCLDPSWPGCAPPMGWDGSWCGKHNAPKKKRNPQCNPTVLYIYIYVCVCVFQV